MIVELFGLPGSGKSVLARELHEHGITKAVVRGRWDLLWCNAIFLVQYPKAFFYLLRLVIQHMRPWSLAYTKFMNLFLHHNAKYIKAKKLGRAVIDQGHLQNILSLFEQPVSEVQIQSYLNNIPIVDMVVILQISDQDRAVRLRSRGHTPREHMNAAYVRNWHHVIDGNYSIALPVLEKKCKVVMVKNNQMVQDVVSQIKTSIV